MRNAIDLAPHYRDELTPGEYVRLYRGDTSNVRSVRITPPRLGQPGFGTIAVEYRVPVFRHAIGGIRPHGL